MVENTFKAYSRDNETYCCNSLGELFDDLDSDGELVVGRVYYEADCRRIAPSDFTRKHEVGTILEWFDERLYEEIGEIADDDFTGVTDEAKTELGNLLAGWIEKNVNIGRYWKIISKTPREMKVGPDDIKESGAA